ncbi:uncharacterized protein LOC125049985 isoform X1 [Pieris napi]|uniref:uncharacterized protein LOC125049985 isoform X1 n=1 Tax=Pieris napi TaxID=78633 RepID=UPI001FB8665D|nr:uncharacterized protein LOC125049985 isoform X1 [Pieris napi]
MYIALRWLFGLSSAMWIAMCCLDIYLNRMGMVSPRDTILPLYQNYSFNAMQTESTADTFISLPAQETTNYSYYHYFMFFTCTIMFIMLQNNGNMNFIARILYALNKQSKMYFETIGLKLHLNKTAIQCRAAIRKYATTVWGKIYKTILEKIDFYYKRQMLHASNSINNNLLLLKRFKELNEERRNLGKLLLTTIRDNKNIRMRYQLENLAKNRLTRYIEDTERLIKKNRCQYVSFQQLYLATHQENVFLKTRIKKLVNERDNAKRNLIALINEVCKSKNKDLKAFCCKFIVETKDNILNSDVKSEIRKFLNNSTSSIIKPEEAETVNTIGQSNSLTNIEYDCFLSQAPKLRGLPGEYVWTVKDKDGLIEKLYEYNFQTDYDNGDTISRIRQYSVYCDKDCLLDYRSSSTIVNDYTTQNLGRFDDCRAKTINYPITRQRFLTGSEAFQKFLKCSGNIVQCSTTLTSRR